VNGATTFRTNAMAVIPPMPSILKRPENQRHVRNAIQVWQVLMTKCMPPLFMEPFMLPIRTQQEPQPV
jgi:hypothetical protein